MKREALEAALCVERRKVQELKAQLASRAGEAFDAMPKARDFMASGVYLQISAPGGADIVPLVCIRDGLSPKTVDALQEDLRRSFELATMVNPAMARKA